jgi:hypothetical protein
MRFVLFGLASGLVLWSAAGAESLRIVVVEGEGAINNIALKRAKDPVIKVETEDGAPVSGAVVHFLAPAQGPGGVFLDGRGTATALTDPQGLATARGFRPNQTAGQFQIHVTASYYGQTATARISQINAQPSAASRGASKKIAILAIVGGAVAGGAALAARGGKAAPTPTPSAAAPATSPGTVITAGNPSFGPP